MAVLRIFSWLLLAFAIALLGADAVSSLEDGAPVMRTTAEILSLVGLETGAITQNAPGGVSNVLATFFNLPLWAVLGLIGVVMTLIFRPID